MILHAASMAALFVDQLAQAPVQIQCVQQSTPESWLKWLLPTIVQTIVSLLSIFAGVCIAVRSFRANKTSEHEQWIRAQKKEEWKDLLAQIAEIEHEIPIAFSTVADHTNLKPVVLGFLPRPYRHIHFAACLIGVEVDVCPLAAMN